MKYPVLTYTRKPGEPEYDEIIRSGDEHDIATFCEAVDKVVFLFKGKEYTLDRTGDEEILTPPCEIIEALDSGICEFMSADHVYEASDKQHYQDLQEALEQFEKTGQSLYLDQKYWTKSV